MSRENVEVIEGAYQAVRGRRMSEWAHRLLPPEIEWHPVPQSPDFEVRRGPQGVSEYFDQVLENAVVWEPRITAVTEAREGIYVIDAEASAESRHGVTGEFRFSQVWEFDGERPVRVREFLDHSQALEAAGLSE
jgi:ketosteroid isomerase-like protein